MTSDGKSVEKMKLVTTLLGSRFLLLSLALTTDVVVSRAMTIEGRGRFLAVLSGTLLVSDLLTFGLPHGFMLQKRTTALGDVLAEYRRVLPPLALVGAAAGSVVAAWYGGALIYATQGSMITGAEIATVFVLPILLQYVGPFEFARLRVMRRAIFLALVMVCWRWAEGPIPLSWVLWAVLAGWLGGLLPAARRLYGVSTGAVESGRLRSWWWRGGELYSVKFIERMQVRIGILLLATLGLPDQAAVFGIAASVIEATALVGGSLSVGLLRKDEDGYQLRGRSVTVLFGGVLLLSALAGLFVVLFGRPVVTYIYGAKYAAAGRSLLLCGPAVAFYGPYPLLSLYLVRSGRTGLVLAVGVSALAASVASMTLLLPSRPTDAAATTSAIVSVSVAASASVLTTLAIADRLRKAPGRMPR